MTTIKTFSIFFICNSTQHLKWDNRPILLENEAWHQFSMRMNLILDQDAKHNFLCTLKKGNVATLSKTKETKEKRKPRSAIEVLLILHACIVYCWFFIFLFTLSSLPWLPLSFLLWLLSFLAWQLPSPLLVQLWASWSKNKSNTDTEIRTSFSLAFTSFQTLTIFPKI